LFGLGFNSQRESLVNEQFGAPSHVLELHLRKRSVGNNQQILIECSQLQGTKPYIFDSSNLIADLAEVADLDCLVHQQRDTTYEILKRFLCGKRYGQSPDAEASDRRLHIEPK